MEKYTIIDRQGNVMDRGLSLTEVAYDFLTYDGFDFMLMRGSAKEYYLFCSTGSRNSPSGFGSYKQAYCNGEMLMQQAVNEEEAFEKFASRIIGHHTGWVRMPIVMTDAEYDAYLIESEDA